jgi:hypothetical protein
MIHLCTWIEKEVQKKAQKRGAQIDVAKEKRNLSLSGAYGLRFNPRWQFAPRCG